MGKILEALQPAQMERITPASQLIIDQTDPASCKCDNHCMRIHRKDIQDFFWRLAGFYPWRCSECGSRMYRFRRR